MGSIRPDGRAIPILAYRFLVWIADPVIQRSPYKEFALIHFSTGSLARPLCAEEQDAGLWDRQGNRWLVFDIDGAREAARQRALPQTPDRPAPQRRLRPLCAPGYTGRKRGEVVRSRTTVLQMHTHQWVANFGNPGNGQYREELRRAKAAIQAYIKAHRFPAERTVLRLDGQYGSGAVICDLADCAYVTRGKDYGLLDHAAIQARLYFPADQHLQSAESGVCRALYDCPDQRLSENGPLVRVIVATHPAPTKKKKKRQVGIIRDGILVLDDTGLPKKGSASVGVFPQYSGTLGKIGNCQVVVSAEFLADDPASSTLFHWPVSSRLFLPDVWMQDADRRKQAQVPESISQQTKPQIALGLLDRARQWGVPIGLVVVDAGYGDNPNFLRGLDEHQVPYVCAVESTFGCRLPHEIRAKALEPAVRPLGRGQPRKPRPAPLHTAKELIDALPTSSWRTVTFREGTKGTMQVQAVAIRVHWATGSALHSTSHSRVQTGPEGWLVAERPLPGADPHEQETPPEETSGKKSEHTKYRFSTLPPDTSLERLVLLAHARWVIEQFYEDGKQECGFDHFQGRSWNGLHRHLALVMLAYSFLMLHRLTLPSDEAFSPLRQAKLATWGASPGAALAVP